MSFKVVILKTKAQSLKQAEQFLRNRQWQVISTTNLRDAIAAIIQRQPEFILIAADHTNRKVRTIPKLISQAFPIKVVGYVEASTNASMAIMNEMGLEYTVFPPVSGPAIERTILKIKKDDEKKQHDKQKAIENGTYIPEPEPPSYSSDAFAAARDLLTRFVNGEEDQPTAESPVVVAPTVTGSENPVSKEGPGTFENPYASSWETDEFGQPIPPPSSVPQAAAPILPDPSEGPIDSSQGRSSSRNKKEAPIMEHDGTIPRKPRPTPTYKQDPSLYPDKDSIIVKGAQTALDESVIVAEPLDSINEVVKATNVACITINSPQFSGYLVAALGADRAIDDAFLKTVQERLFSFLRANGEVIQNDEGMNLKLDQVDFEDWAIAQADFLRKSVHGSDEIAMAFFPSKETSDRLEQSVSEKMLQLSIDELRDDIPVEFDLYIYLPTNQKYLLYTPTGRKLFGQQRGRLRDKGVTHMHLRKDSVGQVKRYRAQVYLNEMIQNFQKKPKIKSAS